MANQRIQKKTAEFFHNLSILVFVCGMPNFWMENLQLSKKFLKIYPSFGRILDFFIYIFLFFEVGAFFTKNDLNEKQSADLLIFGISHPMLWGFTLALSKQTSNIHIILADILQMKKIFNDPKVEEQMVKKSKWYSAAFLISCLLSMLMYTFDAAMQVIVKGGTFTTVVTAWPDVGNNSILANLARIIWNISWWALMIRAMGVYAFVISMTTSLSHQFINLQNYFISLDYIFERKSYKQNEAETKYEEAFKIGIDLFINTVHCVNQIKAICGSVFSGQIVFSIIMLVICMSQLLNSERTFMNTAAIAIAASAVLMSTGLFMCNAGDVTVEVCITSFSKIKISSTSVILQIASHLATAMYFSGWHNCQGQSSINVRKLVVFSMMVAQEPVVIKGLGIMELSYQSYVSLVKSSYSVFSVLY